MTQPPRYWDLFFQGFLRTSPQLSRQLWRAYTETNPYTARTVLWQLDLCTQNPTPERQMVFANLVQPKTLLQLTERLVAGGRRRREVVALEERILAYTNANGGWR
jgi:hypothetical protein